MKDEDKDNRIYLNHILDAIRRIESYVSTGRDDFFESEMIQNAVIWNIGVIGEAARQVSNWLKDAHPEVPWQQIISMRNRLIHGYFNINLDLVWDVVQGDIPSLKTQVEVILEELERQADE